MKKVTLTLLSLLGVGVVYFTACKKVEFESKESIISTIDNKEVLTPFSLENELRENVVVNDLINSGYVEMPLPDSFVNTTIASLVRYFQKPSSLSLEIKDAYVFVYNSTADFQVDYYIMTGGGACFFTYIKPVYDSDGNETRPAGCDEPKSNQCRVEWDKPTSSPRIHVCK